MRQVIGMLQQEPYSEEWKKRASENKDKLMQTLLEENEERMWRILCSYIANGDVNKYMQRQDKQKEFMQRRIFKLLSDNNL